MKSGAGSLVCWFCCWIAFCLDLPGSSGGSVFHSLGEDKQVTSASTARRTQRRPCPETLQLGDEQVKEDERGENEEDQHCREKRALILAVTNVRSSETNAAGNDAITSWVEMVIKTMLANVMTMWSAQPKQSSKFGRYHSAPPHNTIPGAKNQS